MYRLILLVMILILTGFSGSAFADMYKYVDGSGAVCITNSLASVPKKYRSSMTVIKEESAAPKKLLPEVQKLDRDPLPQAVAGSSVETRNTEPPPAANTDRYIRSSIVIVAMVAAYFILRWLGGTLGFPRVGTVLFILCILLGGVYLYGLYIKEMGDVFGALRKDALNIRNNVETRGNKTDQLLKQAPEKVPD